MNQTPRPRILIADDDAPTRLLVRHTLEDEGYTVVEAANGQQVLALYTEQSFDMVLLDAVMPELDGFETCARLRLLPGAGSLAIVMVTSLDDTESVNEAFKAGATDYVVKPIHWAVLRRRVRHLLQASKIETMAQQHQMQRQQVEEVLRTERNLLRTLINNLPDYIYVKDRDGRFMLSNMALAQALGAATSAALVGKTDFDFHPPEMAAYYQANERLVIETGQAMIGQEEPLVGADGSRGWISTTQIPLRDDQGQIIGLVGIGRNITAPKRAAEELQRRNRELTVLNQITAATVISSSAEDILETVCRELALAFNLPRAVAFFYDETGVEARLIAEYKDHPEGTALPPTISTAGSPLLRTLMALKAPQVIANAQSHPHFADTRALLGELGVVSVVILPLICEDKVIGSLVLIATEQRRFSAQEINFAWTVADQVAEVLARLRLNQLHHRLSAAIEQATDTVMITDAAGAIVYANPAFEKVTGYSRAEVVGQNPRILKSGYQDHDFYAQLWATISAGQVWSGRLVNKRKDGSIFTEEATITPVRDDNGTIVNYVAVKKDVTEKLRLEEQLLQSQKMDAIGQLAAGVAHDFNNLLTIIIGYSESLLTRRLNDHDSARKDIERIKRAGERASALTRQLLAFSRKQPLQLQRLNLNAVMTDLEKMLHRLIGENIAILIVPAPDLAWVLADAGQMEQVLLNLAVNARDAMPRGGDLIFETANVILDETYTRQHAEVIPGPYVMLAVSDTGTGMDKETISHIFEPFFTTKEQGKGTGLGLAMAYGIVKQSGGHIWVYSEIK
ncbi:MAG: PAS domain S-box protein [Anaerolineae bacterium]